MLIHTIKFLALLEPDSSTVLARNY